MKHRIEIERTFDAGHRIVGHRGKCARLHGHTYHVRIAIGSPWLVDPGFVVDFGDVKEIVDEWDHMLLLWEMDPTCRCWEEAKPSLGVIRLSFNPTVENMAEDLAQRIRNQVAGLHSTHPDNSTRHPEQVATYIGVLLQLWETPTSSALINLGSIT